VFCPHCQTYNPDEARYCLNCGQELMRRCSNCQTDLSPGARFCMACGNPVLVETPTDVNRLSRLTSVVPGVLKQKMRSASRQEMIQRLGSMGEQRTVTTLLVDVVGSTALAGKLDLETWMELLNHAFDCIAPIIYRYEGTIARILGDSLLAFFGAPVAHEDDPQRAVQAGLEVISQIRKYSQEIKDTHGVDFSMRVCINTGLVIIGPVGDNLTYDYTAFGGTVNLTSRIKFAATPMNVLITGNTFHYVAPYFDCLDLGSINVKGMNEAIRIYQVQAARVTSGRKRGFTELASPLVGRNTELSTLLNLCEAVRAGMGRAVVIVGEPGIGKTRLTQEWQKAAEIKIIMGGPSTENPTTGLWVSGHCISYGQGLAYQLVIDVLKNLIGVTETSDEPETHQALLSLINKLFDDQVMEVYPFLGHLLSLKLEGEALLRSRISDPLALSTQYLLAVQRLFQALMKEKPLILVLEDLHWADASSVELFIKLLPLVESKPILFCLTTRYEQATHGWRLVNAARETMGSSLTEINLHSLTEKDSRTLVANLLEIESLPTRVRDVILYKAEGNPYFVEELIRMFIDQRVIFHQEGAWIARGEISEHDIPDNLQGLLLARIDRLPSEARRTLLVASVIGRNFPVKVLAHILKESRILKGDLSKLESTGLIEIANVEPDLEYMFHHSLVQDAANALLLKKDRKYLHQAVGEAIESLYPEQKKQLAATLGYHFKEAGKEDSALGYFFIAGEEALATNANQEAEIQYRRALELTCLSEVETARLYTGLGKALIRLDRIDETLQALHLGIEIYKYLDDSDGIAQLYSRVARVIWVAGDRPESLRVCLEGMELVKDAPASVGKAQLIHETAREYYFNGVTDDKAMLLCRQALALAKQLGAVNIQAEALVTLGLLLEGISEEEVLQALHKALELAEANGLLDVAIFAHNDLGVEIWFWQADIQATMDHFIRAAELGKLHGVASEELSGLLSYTNCLITVGKRIEFEAEIPHLEELAVKTSNLAFMVLRIKAFKGRLIRYRGDWETAIKINQECLEGYQEQKNLEQILNYLIEISFAMLERHRWGEEADLIETENLLQEALQIVDRSLTYGKMYIYPCMSMLQARQGHLEEARQWLKKTTQVAEKMPTAWDVINQGECEVEIAFAEQDWTKALEAIEKVVHEQQRIGLRVDWAKSLLFWADIHLHRGEPADLERAQSILIEAIAAFNEMGVGRYPHIAEKLLLESRSRLHAQTLNHVQMTRELKKARQVQGSLLPEKPPEIPGWGLEVLLEPAHETSGDFYDFLLLPENNLGIVIADVTDKGTSAALYMALSRSLWRTFAINHPTEPEQTMAETNRRILADTHGGLFITLFYGILNPQNGNFIYCNAGHHPALLVRANDSSVEELEHTGMPLGVFDDATWSRGSVEIKAGDALVLYTDGVTDAQNMAEEFFGLERLEEAVKKYHTKPAKELHELLLKEVSDWVGDAPQFDDITLMVIVRDINPAT
jgi:serine phosphatase RsbU (regulator of sigma subunit)/class 3 adenylate cyclase